MQVSQKAFLVLTYLEHVESLATYRVCVCVCVCVCRFLSKGLLSHGGSESSGGGGNSSEETAVEQKR